MKITGYFDSLKKADNTVKKLKNLGFSNAYVDSNDHYIEARNMRTNLAGTETAPSLSGLVLNSGDPFVEEDKAPLAAANPMVSGMAGFEEIADYSFIAVVETDEKNKDQVAKIIKSMGGELYNPNINFPEPPDDIM